MFCDNAAVAVRERVENKESPPIRAVPQHDRRCGGGAAHRKEVDTPSLVGSCRGTLRAPWTRSCGIKKVDKEDLAAVAAKRAEFRLHHVGTKLNERELRELEALLEEREVTQGEFIRGLILAEIERERQGERASAELVEIMACKLLLVNFLRPLAVGKPLSAETFDAYIGEVRKYKAEAAEKALKEHAERP